MFIFTEIEKIKRKLFNRVNKTNYNYCVNFLQFQYNTFN